MTAPAPLLVSTIPETNASGATVPAPLANIVAGGGIGDDHGREDVSCSLPASSHAAGTPATSPFADPEGRHGSPFLNAREHAECCRVLGIRI